MPQISSGLYVKQLDHKRVSSVLPRALFGARKSHYSKTVSADASVKLSSSTINNTCPNISPADAVGKLILKRSGAWVSYKGETFARLLLKDYIFRLHDICPQVVRRFWRVRSLNPNDVLEILLGSECELGGYEIEVKKVESLWEIFKMASDQVATFDHLPQSCKIMASMLVRAGLYGESEHLLSRRECERVLVDFEGVFSDLIEGYTKEFELDKAIEIYKRMRKLSLIPSVPTYHALIKYLVELNETALMHVVYEEMIKMHAITGTVEDMSVHDDVIRMLCKDGKVQEARDLVRKFLQFKIEPSDLVVSAICRGYCYKKDYDDLLSFLAETSVSPDALIGNKILFSFCQNFSVDHAIVFLRKLEELGYCPNEITLGILISFSCREGKLKNALIYISDILSRGAKPHVYTYNALLSGTFKKRMWMHVRDILLDMNEVGVTPNMSTFRVLIAGFCQARKFDEVKAVVSEMADRGLIKLSSVEDPITRAFTLVGFSPSQVKIKRDNDKGFSRTEFYDDLGNGLYLDAELNEYEKKVAKVLDDAMMLDFNSIMIDRCRSQDIKGALSMVDDIVNWGQRISQPAFALLLDLLSRTSCNIKTIDCVLDIMFGSLYQLDHKTLNFLVQTYSKNGFTSRARTLVDGMLRRCQLIEEGTFSTLLVDSCKNGDLRNFHHYFNISQKSNSFLEIKDCESLLGHLIRNKWLNEALEVFEIMLSIKPDNVPGTLHLLFKKLSRHGFSEAAYMLVEEFANKALFLDKMDYQYLISRLCREKRFKEASKLYDVMLIRDVSPPVDASIELISHLCRTNSFDRAVKVKNLCSKDQPSALNHLNRALINGACKLRRLDEAISLFKEVLSKDPAPNVELFNSLIKVYCDENDMKKVRELLGYVIKNELSISTYCYSNMVRLMRTERNLSAALNLKDAIFHVTDVPEISLYNILIFRLSSKGNSALFNDVVRTLEKKGLQFDAATYNFLITGFLSCKDVSSSLYHLSAMMRQGLRPSNRVLRKFISYLCCNGKINLALDLSREMESRGWIHSTVVQSRIVEALLSNSQVDEALEFLDRMESKGLSPDNISYDYLIKLLCRHDRLEKAVHLLDLMLKKGNCPEATSYDCIIQGFCNSRHMLDKALDFHAEMLCRNLKPNSVTWDALVSRLSKHSRVAEAESLLDSMILLGSTPSKKSFQSVIDVYRSSGDFDKTSRLLKLMQQCGYEPDFETHWSVISNLSSSTTNSSFLSGLVSGFGFMGKTGPNSKK